jgi:serine/threonine protein kinase
MTINILDRFIKYDKINSIINDKIKNAANKCLYPIKNGVYTLNDVILLYKRIGVDSSYGSVFVSEIKDKKKKYTFATKIQLLTTDTYEELKYLNYLTKIAIATGNIHLPLIYSNLECSYYDKKNELLPKNLILTKDDEKYEEYKNINSYNSTFVELANGDLGTFINKNIDKITNEQFKNALSQCFIGILTCHQNNIKHNDSHLYNFLYHIIKKQKKSCFEYKYHDLVFYIENLGLNWVIWDFGLSEDIIDRKNIKFMNDYIELIKTLYEHISPDKFNNYSFDNYLTNIYDNIKLFKEDYDLIKCLLEKKLLFSDKPIGHIITTIIL